MCVRVGDSTIYAMDMFHPIYIVLHLKNKTTLFVGMKAC